MHLEAMAWRFFLSLTHCKYDMNKVSASKFLCLLNFRFHFPPVELFLPRGERAGAELRVSS